jgi:hypothetical protein
MSGLRHLLTGAASVAAIIQSGHRAIGRYWILVAERVPAKAELQRKTGVRNLQSRNTVNYA